MQDLYHQQYETLARLFWRGLAFKLQVFDLGPAPRGGRGAVPQRSVTGCFLLGASKGSIRV